MQDVPNIVRKRLNATVPDFDHPDANLLTSFAEKSLPERERAHVFEHLARCADCREILAFSMPQESVAEPVVKLSPSRWLTWPVLRWGVIAAGIVLVSSVGLIQYRRAQMPMLAQRSESVEVASKQEPSPPSNARVSAEKKADVREPEAATTDHHNETLPREDKVKIAPGFALPATQPSALQPNTAINGALAPGSTLGGPVKKQESQQQAYQAEMPAAPAAPMVKQPFQARTTTANVPKASTTVEVSGAAPQLEARAQPAPAELSSQQQADENSLALSKAKPAMAPSVPSAKMVLAPAPRWTISATGELQRSFDQGQTWQDVNVAANENSSEKLARSFANAAPAGKAVVVKPAASGLIFRAVAVNGSDVWAGGIGGILYHSVDAGANWMRVVISSAGSTLTGDIVHVEFTDLQHGTITTSTGEVWTTPDAGQTWQKQ